MSLCPILSVPVAVCLGVHAAFLACACITPSSLPISILILPVERKLRSDSRAKGTYSSSRQFSSLDGQSRVDSPIYLWQKKRKSCDGKQTVCWEQEYVMSNLFLGSRNPCTDINYQREKKPQHQCHVQCVGEPQCQLKYSTASRCLYYTKHT